MTATDEQLLKILSQEGDDAAFETISQRYLGLIYNTAYRRTGSRVLAEDAAQRVLCILAKKAGSLCDRGDSLGAWLHRTTFYEASKVMRAEISYARKKIELEREVGAESGGAEGGASSDLLPHLDRALNKLPKIDREILLLHYFDGDTFEQIASKIGKSLAATQKRSQRALQKMSQMLERKGITLSVLALSALLGSELARGAPQGLAKSLTAKSFLADQKASALWNFSPSLTAAAFSAVMIVPILYQENQIREFSEVLGQVSKEEALEPSTRAAKGMVLAKRHDLDLSSMDPFALAKAYYTARKENLVRYRKITDYLESLPFENLLELFVACSSNELPPRYQDGFMSRLVHDCSEKNPKRISEMLIDLSLETPPRNFLAHLDEAVEKWTARNPTEAAGWLKKQLIEDTLGDLTSHGSYASRVMKSHLTQLIKTSPQLVPESLEQIPYEERGPIIGRAFHHSYSNQTEDTVVMDKVVYGLSLARQLPTDNRAYLIRPLTSRAIYSEKSHVTGLENLLAHPDLQRGDDEIVYRGAVSFLVETLNGKEVGRGDRAKLQELEDWLFKKSATVERHLEDEFTSSVKRPGDKAVRILSQRYPSIITSYLQNKGTALLLKNDDKNFRSALKLVEMIPDSKEREETREYLRSLNPEKVEGNRAR